MHKAWAPNQPHRGEIAKLLVRASHRGSGIGRMLMEHAEDHARASGISLLTLDARQERLYQRLGWTCSGTIPVFAVNADRSGMHATVVHSKLVACVGLSR
jgi:GNAT superfamily N-acetyltransferase